MNVRLGFPQDAEAFLQEVALPRFPLNSPTFEYICKDCSSSRVFNMSIISISSSNQNLSDAVRTSFHQCLACNSTNVEISIINEPHLVVFSLLDGNQCPYENITKAVVGGKHMKLCSAIVSAIY